MGDRSSGTRLRGELGRRKAIKDEAVRVFRMMVDVERESGALIVIVDEEDERIKEVSRVIEQLRTINDSLLLGRLVFLQTNALSRRGDMVGAVRAGREALSLLKSAGSRATEGEVLGCQQALGRALKSIGRNNEAEQLMRAVLAHRSDTDKRCDPEFVGCRQDLVEIALMRKDNDEAERHCRALMAMTEDPSPSEVGRRGEEASLRIMGRVSALQALGSIAEERKGLDAAEEYDRQAWDLMSDTLKENPVGAFSCMGVIRRMALRLLKDGLLADATRVLEATFPIYEHINEWGLSPFNKDFHYETNKVMRLYAQVLPFIGQTDLARRITADLDESEAIMAALHQAVVDETRIQARAEAAKGASEKEGQTEGGSTGGRGLTRKQRKRTAKKRGKAQGEASGRDDAAVEEATVEDAEQRQEQAKEEEEEEAEKGDARPTDLASQEQEKVEEAAAARGRGEECAICLIEVDADPEVLTCGHEFHLRCISLWSSNCENKSLPLTCPTCRHPIMNSLRSSEGGAGEA